MIEDKVNAKRNWFAVFISLILICTIGFVIVGDLL